MWGKFEPVLNATTVGALFAAVITLGAVFLPDFTLEQQVAVGGLGAALISIMFANAVAARESVTPIAKVVDTVIPFVPRAGRAAAIKALKTGTTEEAA